MEVYQGLIVEAVITFLLVLTVLASVDTRRRDLGGSGPLAIGLSIAAAHFGFVSVGVGMTIFLGWCCEVCSGPFVVVFLW